MITRRTLLALMGSTMLPRISAVAAEVVDPDPLKTRVAEGVLPPLAERLPKVPRVVPLDGTDGGVAGRHGGTVKMLIASQRDIRYMPINGYSRLIGFDRHFNFHPDLLERYEVEGERIFTFHLRPGHRWSDGSPFTTEDFRYVWEDMFHDKELHKGGIPTVLRVKGKEPVFEVIDEVTVRYSWEDPNPDFLAELASPVATRLMLPAAYLKQFHHKYQTPERLAALIEQQRVDDWVSLHQKMSRTARPENPDLPTLDPWRATTVPPAGQFVFERNAYFHRVDGNGLQLPYIDRVVLNVGSGDLVAAKAASGESDLQFTNIDFADYTFLKSAEKRGAIKVSLWKRIQGSRVALIPNLNCTDLIWRQTMRDVRVRRALSLAINRDEINKAVFFGLGSPSANAVLPDSPLFRPEYRDAWAEFDPDRANALLDEAGLLRDGKYGLRYLSDGRPCKLIIETTAETTFDTDVLELVTDHWRRIGFRIFTHVSHRELFRQRITSGETVLALSPGLDNGVPTADMSPRELAPTNNDQIQWPLWGLHQLSGGGEGRPPEIPEAQELLDLFHQWREADTLEEREVIWHRMLSIFTQQVFTIGIVNAVPQPIVRANRLRNLPSEGLYGFDPTSYLGVYMPDTFWLEGGA
ncbi:ABC transporter substrate-binding protein [Rhizobium cremeum]|uniref:ABC transporter substrate-binding protein n=1 Tax=Rhizobium cremeum TaxID=2813827 RepID=UPI000DE0AF00|nr:ABC transporter substrate-binding protein [Rhizobium cremeum]MCJ7997338.1 ABC transporter substrate-binding protein [Rhizobium cremeum]MCJ8002432.1 ABC transporter substrate-binding protein [Rhizobium cremeum]